MTALLRTAKAAILSTLAGLATAVMLLSAGCGGEESQPVEMRDDGQAAMEQKLDRMSTKVAVLEKENEQARAAGYMEEPDEPTAAPDTPVDGTATITVQPTISAAPTPTAPGICGRSPQIQYKLLATLNLELCQVTTNDELYRIQTLQVKMQTARSGDFDGLVNVKSIELTAWNIEPAGLSGLSSLEHMTLSLNKYGSVAPGAFQGLNKLETLWISPNSSSSSSPEKELLTMPAFDHLPSLKTLKTGISIPLDQASSQETIFRNLPNLEILVTQSLVIPGDEPGDTKFLTPNKLFDNNPNLKSIQLTFGDEDAQVRLPESLFSNNPLLEMITIGGNFRVQLNTFKHLEKLRELRLEEYRTNEGEMWHEIELNESSPLYNLITYGSERTSGYALPEKE